MFDIFNELEEELIYHRKQKGSRKKFLYNIKRGERSDYFWLIVDYSWEFKDSYCEENFEAIDQLLGKNKAIQTDMGNILIAANMLKQLKIKEICE